MRMDLYIQDIVNAYYCKTDKWSRRFFAPRNHDGIVLFTEGAIEYSFFDKKVTAQKGDLLFLPGNVAYSGKKLCETVAFYVIDFNCAAADEFERLFPAVVLPAKDYTATEAGFAQATELWTKQRIDRNFRIKSFLYSILCHAVDTGTQEKHVSATATILDYICENIHDASLSVKQLCSLFHISESQLRRNILKQTGLKPNEYILRTRLNLAKNELTYTTESIQSVSEHCGFSSPYYFSNCFSKFVGISPAQYRLRTRSDAHP